MWMIGSSGAGLVLVGQVGRFLRWDFCLSVGGLIGVIGLGVWAWLWVKRWRTEVAEEASRSPAQQLEHYQKMMDDGLLDPEEFARVKARLEGAPPPPDTRITSQPTKQPPDTSFHEK
jgi:hypothetical protein